MTNEAKVAITNAIYTTYFRTTEPYRGQHYGVDLHLSVPTDYGVVVRDVRIVRVHTQDDLLYELFIDDTVPFMSVFGCWPIGFVADIFIKTLEHYYDWY